jgi:predicted O-methyltransferase YrrM
VARSISFPAAERYPLRVTTIGEIIYEELPAFMQRTGKKTLRVLEVGVLRNLDQDHEKGDGHSTLAFARLLKAHPGSTYVGIDLDPHEARHAVDAQGFGEICDFYAGDSVGTMTDLKFNGEKFDVIYLDADNDGAATFREYLLALDLVNRPGLIMGDDMNTDHREVRKGRVLIPFLREDGAEFKLRQRHTPWDTRDILVQELS